MKYIFILSFLAVNSFIYGQHQFGGKILDQGTGKPIVGANVYIQELNKGSFTDSDGIFEFQKIPSGNYTLLISALGYAEMHTSVEFSSSKEILLKLKPVAIEIDEVIISTAFQQLQRENVVKVPRMNLDNIQNNIDLSQEISEIPGVENMSTGTGIGKPVIRGLHSNRILVYTQGIRMENQQFGAEHGLGINVSGMESVEVIKGPASLLYGSDALGGVLYFNPEKYLPQDSTAIHVGSTFYTNTLGTSNNLALKSSGEEVKFLIRGNYTAHSDYKTGHDVRVTNTRFQEWDLKTGVAFENKFFESDLRYNYNNTTLGIPEGIGFQTTSKVVQEPFQAIENHVISLSSRLFFENYKLESKFGFIANNRQEFEAHHEHEHEHILENEIEEVHTEDASLEMQLETFSYDVKYYLPNFGVLKAIVGLQGIFQENENFAEEILIPDAKVTDFGMYLNTQAKLTQNSVVQAGVRWDQRSIDSESHFDPSAINHIESVSRDFNSFNTALGLKYDFSKNFTARINFSSGFRAPNLAEFTSNGRHHGANRYEIGNAFLDNETAYQLDLSLEYQKQDFEVFVNGFINKIENYIFLRPTDEFIENYPVFEYMQADAQLYGGEAGFILDDVLIEDLYFQSSFSMVIGKRAGNVPLPLIPAHNILNVLSLEVPNLGPLLDISAYISSKSFFAQNRTSVFETRTNGYSLINLGFEGDFVFLQRKIQFGLSVNNVFNTAYISHLSRLKVEGISNMGRNIVFSLRTSF